MQYIEPEFLLPRVTLPLIKSIKVGICPPSVLVPETECLTEFTQLVNKACFKLTDDFEDDEKQ